VQDTELLEISSIRDTRCGRCARVPKDPKLRETVTMGSPHDLEEKTLTVVYGSDFVNVQFVNFCCKNKETAKVIEGRKKETKKHAM
jgi:phosphatidylinositol phospholipase C beta